MGKLKAIAVAAVMVSGIVVAHVASADYGYSFNNGFESYGSYSDGRTRVDRYENDFGQIEERRDRHGNARRTETYWDGSGIDCIERRTRRAAYTECNRW